MNASNDFELVPDHFDSLLVHQLVELTTRRSPQRIAVLSGEEQVTYETLNARADALCQAILHHDPDSEIIGISTHRCVEMVIGVLAIMKAGKAYLPLDPSFPANRLEQIVSDSQIKVCLTNPQDTELFQSLGLQTLSATNQYDYPYTPVAHQSKLCFVLYTSGSTGKPKGVCMGHKPMMNLLYWQNLESRATEETRTLQFSPLIFDPSFLEMFSTFSLGGTLVLIDEETRADLGSMLLLIEKQRVNRLFLPFVALQYLSEAAVNMQKFPACLQEVMTAGEQLKVTPQLVTFFSTLPDCTLFNQYGPTECHVVTQLKLEGEPNTWPPLPTIGIPILNTDIYMTDEQMNLLPDGEIGELCIGGVCLAEGYLNRPELTEQKFVYWNHPTRGRIRIYRSGDLARFLPDGNIEFLGRKDDQVKIRGHRVELGEVEVTINNLAGIKQAVVVAREDRFGQKQLVAYVISSTGKTDTSFVRRELEKTLPDYMMPSVIFWMDDFPKTTSGKVDKKALPKPEMKRSDMAGVYRKPKTEVEKNIASVWTDLLQIDKVGLDDNFFEMGGNSLLAQRTVGTLQQQFQYTLPITKLYQHPTVGGIAAFLQPKSSATQPQRAPKEKTRRSGADVAVIGMSGRFPGASSVDELWKALKAGQETTRFFTTEELDASIPESQKNDPTYVRARGIIDGIDQFDPAFFGLNPKAATAMDPQQRVFMEIAWEVLEQTGYVPQHYDGTIGVYAGSGNNTYYLYNVLRNQRFVEQVGSFQAMTLNEKDYIASRTAYQLNLKGPAVSVYSACSSSLLAITQAVDSIRNGMCDLALAGGASVTSPVNSGHLYQEGAMLSRDGHCRSFDADGNGTVFSDGAGVVLLKSLEDAQRDGDTIYAVIKGVGVNNDGAGKGSFTAPNAEGQAGAIRMALEDANVDPATIQYVEAHGTATPVGDPIEIEGLTMAFGEQAERQFCAIGSIKSNMGHLTAAAGVAGFIKTTLALYNRQIPPSLGFSRPNPAIDFANSPFFVTTKLTPWESETIRRAGVSSFGVGGTNVHVVLEEAPAEAPISGPGRSVQLLTWSAKSVTSRDAYTQRLAAYVQQPDAPELADVAFSLQTTRADFDHRRFALATSAGELAESLLTTHTAPSESKTLDETPGEVVFLFPGQGAQYLNMGRQLYETEPVYRQAVDACADLLQTYLDTDIRQVMYAEPDQAMAEERLKNTRYTQPALFVTEYALAQLWMSWGIQPTIFCGHSIGEFVAAHLSGVFSLADALKLIAVRGRMVSELPRGSMLSVRTEAEKVTALMPETLSMAAINSTKLCVVAGQDEDIAMFARQLDEQEIPNRVLLTSHAFHSAMMDPIVDEFKDVVASVSLSRPQKPIVSTVTGSWMTDAQAIDPVYWAQHLRMTVRFADALETLFELDKPLLLEAGPGNVTATLARQQAGSRPVTALASLEGFKNGQSDHYSLLKTLGQLWLAGLEPDWKAFYGHQMRLKVNLPTYAFDKKRYWVDPVKETPIVDYNPIPQEVSVDVPTEPTLTQKIMRKDLLIDKIKEILEDASGIEMEGVPADLTFLEVGLDSLLLTQVALALKKEFELPITFRQLNEELATLNLLAAYLDESLPATAYQPAPVDVPVSVPAPAPAPVQSMPTPAPAYLPPSPPAYAAPAMVQPNADSALSLITQQLHLLARQIELLQGAPAMPAPVVAPPAPAAPVAPPAPVASAPAPTVPASSNGSAKPAAAKTADLTPEEEVEIKKPFGAAARIERHTTELTPKQETFLQQLIARYNKKTAKSKNYTQEHRAHMADPRVVSGFKPLTKEIVYPIVVNKSKGSRLWDLDGNEYIDALNGFGSNMLGYQPDIIKKALQDQIELGYEIGPQHELAGEVSELLCEFTGFDRAALCNTGSEAVLGVMRIARTVTGRSLIVAFSGSYHGIVDEVIIRGTKKLKSFPAAPGIMPEAVQNMLILDYGTEESLKIIRERAHELAAVLVEPVQSRRPEFRPVEFLKEVRAITEASGTALIFDEVITGFRMHPGGAQALFGIKADLGSYGKVIGGGLSIGVIAGKKQFMDALDGGFWQFGDHSFPEVGVTYFAGTFVRHPLALAAAKASLQYMKERGPALQKSINAKAERLADTLNAEFEQQQLPFFVAQFGSLWKIKFKEEVPYSELLFTLMRDKGIHIWDGFPCFMTDSHTDAEIDEIIRCFRESIREMIEVGFFKAKAIQAPQPQPVASSPRETDPSSRFAINEPPVPGAKLGRDRDGNPAWFVINPDQPGKYMQVELK